MFRKKKSILGLDIGTTAIKAVEIHEDKEQLRITGFGRIEIASEESRPEAIAELLSQGNFQTKRVASAVSGKSVAVRYVPVVKMEEEELQNHLRFEAEKFFPYDIGEMQLDSEILGDVPRPEGEEGPPEMKVLLVGVKKSLVEDQAQLLLEVGLQPTVIDVDAFTLGNAFEFRELMQPTEQQEGKAIALIDLGANKTSINILSRGQSCFTREIYVGGNDFTAAIARHLGIETHEAEEIKRHPKDDEQTESVQSAIGPVFDDLTNELKLSFDFFEHQNDEAIGQVFLSGGGALAPYIEGAFERALERETRRWNPLEGFEIDETRVDAEELAAWGPTLPVAMGLASRLVLEEGAA